ncbi:hypothetical protein RO3G_01473 [Lichtheimia corymbifera JMRC:FSU:9682]|uniref:Reverse transcriptase n=1 Tax=Lichtheimia corymbifera JMRC:FSU:9682 TaxID=1263082 RepID=A0A068SCA3_9FUNG|nr:hypothetical protein RO3G_01473 [Lichtheimia corymbifera JMRC:FSU:9682]
MTISDSVPWSQVVAKSARMRVITPARRSQNSEISTDIFQSYEDPDFTKQQMARKAAAIVRQALTPDSVLFTVPTSAFAHRSDVYKAIETQIGPLGDVRPLSLYDVRTRGDFLIEAKFAEAAQTDAAINRGITINDVVYQASPSFVGAENPLIRVHLNLMQMGSSSTIKQGLLDSLRYYGKVYQIRRILENGYFEGKLTIAIDPSEGYVDAQGKLRDAQPLQRMLYLETWDTFAPASFKGAAPVCFYCRQAGHIRKACPELAKRVCFECGESGHTRKFCKATITDAKAIALYEQESANREQRVVEAVVESQPDLATPSLRTTSHKHNDKINQDQTKLVTGDDIDKTSGAVRQDSEEILQTDIGSSSMDVDKPERKALEDVDPEFGINSSKWAPYDKATRMKVDEDEPEDELHLVKVTGKRSILKNKQPSMSLSGSQNFDLDLDPVVPPPHNTDIAQHSPTTQRPYVYNLRTAHNIDILCLQETATASRHPHLTTDQVHSFTRFMFPNCSTIITKHVAIICLRQDLTLDNTMVSMDERVVVASVLDQQQHTLCRVINTYVPAEYNARRDFLCSFLSLPFVAELEVGPWLLLGDFNLNLHNYAITRSNAVKSWYEWVQMHFDNCMPQGLPTFTRGDTRTTIDYIYGHSSLMTRITNANQHFLPASWTDHSLLTVDILPARQDFGRGSWRFNPTLLTDEGFVTLLDQTVDTFFVTMDSTAAGTPQEQWESFKRLLKCTAKHYSRGSTSRRQSKLTKLQAERQVLLSDSRDTRLIDIDEKIDTLIRTDTSHAMLRSATRWHEQGERNNKYFFRVIKERQAQQTITALKGSDSDGVLTDIQDIIKETRKFYSQLYTPEDIDLPAMEPLLQNIPSTATLSAEDTKELTEMPHIEDILDLVDHAPSGRSPGLDGIPFEVYKHLLPRSPRLRHLLLIIIRQAMEGIFPQSWSHTRMVLLFKKGDPELLRNWRPLSLINMDAKLFTKMLANRFNQVLPKLINPYQTGFMPHRLISDNGWINQVLMHNQRTACPMDPTVAVFLDQEKAYDRVHPEYLRRVMAHFGFPPSIIQSLSCLFFNTQVHVSINGHLVHPPRDILPAPPGIKLLSYADDLEVFLSHTDEWPILMDLLQRYGAASNAKVNLSKTMLMSLSGTTHTDWQPIAQTYGAQWLDASSTEAVRYLGYPLYHTADQLASFLDLLKLKLLRHTNILKERRLSLRGASTVANSLLLSRLWHILRVTPVPHHWLSEMKSIVLSFIAPFWPKPA